MRRFRDRWKPLRITSTLFPWHETKYGLVPGQKSKTKISGKNDISTVFSDLELFFTKIVRCTNVCRSGRCGGGGCPRGKCCRSHCLGCVRSLCLQLAHDGGVPVLRCWQYAIGAASEELRSLYGRQVHEEAVPCRRTTAMFLLSLLHTSASGTRWTTRDRFQGSAR